MANSWSDRRGGSAIPHFDQRELALALRVVRGFDVRSEACDGNRVRGRSSASALALSIAAYTGAPRVAIVGLRNVNVTSARRARLCSLASVAASVQSSKVFTSAIGARSPNAVAAAARTAASGSARSFKRSGRPSV